jgi:hypothetical protein
LEKAQPERPEEVDPRNIDRAVLLDADKYGGEAFTAALKRQGADSSRARRIDWRHRQSDDFSACEISQKRDWRDLL